ncbi:MAG: hypothetical protein ACI8V5_000247 [Limisphaerales bacterium]|jgi:hypothetical protein
MAKIASSFRASSRQKLTQQWTPGAARESRRACPQTRRWTGLLCPHVLFVGLLMTAAAGAQAATPGLPFTEPFDDTDLQNGAATTANWDIAAGELRLQPTQRHFGAFTPGNTTTTFITADSQETYDLATGDVNGDGLIDIVAANGNQINRVYLNGGGGSFLVGQDVGVETDDSQAIALADLDNDGDLDLVVGNFSDSVNRIYFNNGTGAPFTGVIPVNLTDDAHDTRAVLIADLNGDQFPDIIVGNDNQRNLLYLNNGTATPFDGVAGQNISPDAAATKALAVADLDHDGLLDIVVGNRNSPNTLYLNTGNAADPFGGAAGMEITRESDFTEGIAVADLNNDGFVDVYAANDFEQNRVYLNNGAGAGLDPFLGVLGQSGGPDIQGSTSVALGDVDKNGSIDAVIGNAIQPNRHYRNNGGLTPFVNTETQDITTAIFQTAAIKLVDIDNDGDLDTLVGDRNGLNRIHFNDSATDDIFLGIPSSDLSTNIWTSSAIATGDIDNDGDLDLLVANGVTVTVNRPNVAFLNNGTPDPFNGSGAANITADAVVSTSIAVGDIDGDGDLDVVIGNTAAAGLANRRYLGNGNGTFGNGANINADADVTQSVALGDLDGDGDLDLVAGNAGGDLDRIYLNGGGGAPWATTGNGAMVSADVAETRSIALGDIDNDGNLDLVVGNAGQVNRRYLGNGAGAFAAGVDIDAATDATSQIRLADVNCDGDLDLVVGNAGNADKLYLGNGDGTFGAAMNIGAVANTTTSIQVADMNKDGLLDVLAGTSIGALLYQNNGSVNPFNMVIPFAIAGGANVSAIDAADFNGDGSLDVALGNDDAIDTITLNPIGPISFNSVDAADIQTAPNTNLELLVADLNGDGRLDVLRSVTVGNLIIGNLNNGQAFPNDSLDPDVELVDFAGTIRSLALGDVNQDGLPDLAVGLNGIPSLFLNSGNPANPFSGPGENIGLPSGLFAADIEFGDIDGDGFLDAIVAQDFLLGGLLSSNYVFINSQMASPFNGVAPQIIGDNEDESTAIALGDLDGDGDLDVIFSNGAQANRYHLNDGIGGLGNGILLNGGVTDTRNVAIGDVDNDGDLDAVVANFGSQNLLYLNDGAGDPFTGVNPVDITQDMDNSTKVHLTDLDHDGDLDLIVGNDAGQKAKLYLNDGSADPFGGVLTGNVFSTDMLAATGIGSGDFDKNGTIDLAVGGLAGSRHYFQSPPLYFDQTLNRAGSIDINQSATPTDIILLTPTLPAMAAPNTSIDYFASNDGGTTFLNVKPGVSFAFPNTGNDLRWRARLNTLSPSLTPILEELLVELIPSNIAPVIAPQTFAIDEHLGDGMRFGPVVATDPDNMPTPTQNLTYSITTPGMPFTIDPTTGELIVSDTAALDFETVPGMQFMFTVEVTDDGLVPNPESASATITVTLNDIPESPTIADQSFSIPENRPNTTVVGTIAANDPDTGEVLTFTVLSGHQGAPNLFLVDPMTGEITVNNSAQLDFEIFPQTVLNVQVSDSGAAPGPPMTSASANITINLLNLDEAPLIGPQILAVSESAPNGLPVGIVVATELDLQQALKYRITAGNPTGIFAINENTGEITVADGSQLDKEMTPSYILTVETYGLGPIGPPFTVTTPIEVGAVTFENARVRLHDMDGDGDLDALIGGDLASGGGNEINRIFLNNGQPDPFNSATALPITSDANNSTGIAVGDVNGDMLPDVVVANFSQPNRLYLNNDAGFDMDPFNLVTGSNISGDADGSLAIELLDANQDMLLDVLVGNLGNVKLYLNDGAGDPFDTLPAIVVPTAGRDAFALAVGFVNSDTRQDFVLGSPTPGLLQNSWYRNNGASSPFDGTSPFDVTGDMDDTFAVALADLNGDNSLDIVVGNASIDPTVRNKFYLNDRTAIPFSAGSGVAITSGPNNTLGVGVGDIDNDGDIDVLFANGLAAEVSLIFENNGTFDPFNGVPGRTLNAGNAIDSRSIALGDVDGDGDLDVLLGNANAPSQLYLNDYTSRLTNSAIVTINIQDANEAPVVNDQVFNIDENSPLMTPVSPGGIVVATDPDLPMNTLSYGIIGDNSGGAFALDPVTGNLTVADASKLDFETDMSFELTVEVVDDGGGSTFSSGNSFDITTEANNTQAILLHDMNQDDLPDLVIGNYNQQNLFIPNNGTADPFVGSPVMGVSGDLNSTRTIAIGDFNGNTAPDLVFGNDAGPNRLVLNNNSPLPFDGATGLDITLDPSTTLSIGAADLDTDGHVDVVSGNLGGKNRYYRNNGSINPFVGVVGLNASPTTAQTRSIQLADMDGDGHIDIVEAVEDSPIQLRLNDGDGPGLDPFDSLANTDIGVGMIAVRAILVGDVNGDLAPDVIVATANKMNTAQNLLFLNLNVGPGADPFAGVVGIPISADTHESVALALGDLNNDGFPDLVVGNFDMNAITGQINRLYLNNGTDDPFNGVIGIDITSDAHKTTSVAIGDVNGDGRADIIVGNENEPNRLYVNNRKSATATITININDRNDPPSAMDQTFTIAENLGNMLPVGTVLATDQDTGPIQNLSFAFNPPVHPAFEIDGMSGAITVKDSTLLDFEATPMNQFTITTEITDDGGPVPGPQTQTRSITVTIELTNENDPPVIAANQMFNINENTGNGTPVGTVLATDDDTANMPPDEPTFRFDPAVHPAFEIDTITGLITVKDMTLLDAETTTSFTPTIFVSDGAASDTKTITILIDNVNEPPVIPAGQTFSIPETAMMNDPVIGGPVVANTVELGEIYTYSIAPGSPFDIHPTSGQITFVTPGAIDYEPLDPNFFFQLDITVTDNGQPMEPAMSTVTVNINDVNEPVDLAAGQMFTIDENLGNGLPVGMLNFSDPDLASVETYVFNITGAAFTVSPDGAITVADSSQLDFEMTPIFMETVTVTDRAGTGIVDMETVTINLTDKNDPPDITLPAPVTLLEDAIAVISGITISDDESGAILIDLAVDQGVISLTSMAGLTPIDNDGSDGTLQFSGSQANITAALMNSVSYTPTSNYNGPDQLTVTANDQDPGGAATSMTMLGITVTPVNDKPTFTAVDPPTSMEDDLTVQTVLGWATFDPGNANETGQVAVEYFVAGVNNTALFTEIPEVAANGDLTYTLAPDANGISQFTVSVRDNGGQSDGGINLSDIQTFEITISDVNDKPTFTAANPPGVVEGSGAHIVNTWVTLFDPGNAFESLQTIANFTISNISDPSFFTIAPDVDSPGALSYTLAPDASGSVTFEVSIQDSGGRANGGFDTSDSLSFTLTVTDINDKPTFTTTPATLPPSLEDSGTVTISNWAALDPGNAFESGQMVDHFDVNVTSGPGIFLTPPAIDANGTLTYTPAADANGDAMISVTVTDDGESAVGVNTSDAQTFTISVTPVNDAPSFTASDPTTVNEDSGMTTQTGWASAFDSGPANESGQAIDAGGYAVTVLTNPGIFSAPPAVADNGDLSFSLAAGGSGQSTFSVTVRDNGGTADNGANTSAPQTFTLTVDGVNDKPSFTASNPPTILEDAAVVTIPNWAAFDPGAPGEVGQAVMDYLITGVDAAFFETAPDVDNNGQLTYHLAADVNGMTTFTVEVQDNGGSTPPGIDTSDPATFTITVTPVNDEPTFTATNPPAVNEDATMVTVNGWVTKFDAGPNDENGQTPTYTVENVSDDDFFAAPPLVMANGDLTYTPADDVNGTATFTVKVQDSGGLAVVGDDNESPVSAPFTITVNSVNDRPTISLNPLSDIDEDAGMQTVNGFAEFAVGADNESGQTIDSFLITGLNNPGLFTPTGQPAIDKNSGDLSYTPATHANGAVTFNVAVRDTGGGDDTSAALPATFTINAVNDPPVITLPMTAPIGPEDAPLTIAGISVSDVDAGTESLLVNLSIKAGSISLFQGSGLAFNDIDGTDGSLEFFGSQSSLTSALQTGINFVPPLDFHGVLVLNVTVNDQGKNGNGGALTTTETLQLTITPGNDKPTIADAAFNLAENSPNGTAVGATIGSDPELQPFNGAIAEPIANDAAETRQIAALDLNGDNNIDFVAVHAGEPNRLYLGAGGVDPLAGVMGANFSSDLNDTRAVIIADVNNDTFPDVLFGNGSNQPNRLYLNNGTADPFNNVMGIDITSDAHDTRSLALANLTADDRPDLIVGNASGQPNRLYINNGTADPFNGVSGIDITSDALDTYSVAIADVDGDMDLDLVTGNANGQRNRLYLNNGTDTPFFGIAGVEISIDAQNTHSVALWDVNGDNAPDLIAANFGEPNRLYLNNGTTLPFNNVPGTDISSDANNSTSIAVGDVNGDMKSDLLFGNRSQPNRLFLNNSGPAPFSAAGFNATPAADATRSVAFANVNNDAILDIVVGNDNAELNRVILNGGQTDTLTYAITGNTGGAFAIDPQTGAITVANSAAVDFETTPVFNLVVIVIDDGAGNLSDTANVTVSLSNVNEPPTLGGPTTAAATEDIPLTISGVTVTDPDAGTQPILIELSTVVGSISLTSNAGLNVTDADGSDGTLAFDGPQTAINAALANSISYQPQPHFNGMDVLTITSNDQGESGSGTVQNDSRTVAITVAAVNDKPSTSGLADILVIENALNSPINLFAAFTDVEDSGPQLTFTIENNSNPGLFNSTIIDGTAGTLTLDYATDAPGISLFTVRATDSGTDFVEAAFQVTVREFQQSKSVAGDSGEADWLGYSVAIHGDFMVAGAWRDNDLGDDSGSAYVFQRRPGLNDAWDQVAKLNASDGAAGDSFGRSVAIEGDTVVVGADRNDDAGDSSGSVYVFQRNQGGPDQWEQVVKLVAADATPGSQFGWSVSLSGDTLVVGSFQDDISGRPDAGSAYIFERNQPSENDWGQSRKLIALDGASDDWFGASVSVNGDLVLIGAPADADNGDDSGSAYLFGRNQSGGGQWGLVRKLLASDGSADDWFGWSVDIAGGFAAIGAYRDDGAAVDSGSAYVFDRNEGGADQWGQSARLLAADGEINDLFGFSVSVDGDNVVVGAYRNDDNGSESGSAYQFSRNQGGPNNWGQLAKLLANDAATGAQFGFSVALDRNSMAVGAPLASTTATQTGAFYTFRIGSPIEDFRLANFTVEELADPSKEATLWGDNADPDMDGQGNFFEFVAGLDPQNTGSQFAFTIGLVPGQPTQRKITYGPIVPGRSYVVEFTDALGSTPFATLAGGIVTDVADMRCHTDTSPMGFRVYRVRVSVP